MFRIGDGRMSLLLRLPILNIVLLLIFSIYLLFSPRFSSANGTAYVD